MMRLVSEQDRKMQRVLYQTGTSGEDPCDLVACYHPSAFICWTEGSGTQSVSASEPSQLQSACNLDLRNVGRGVFPPCRLAPRRVHVILI
jgi:hypothetical protein